MYTSLEQQAQALDVTECAEGVPVPIVKVMTGHLGPHEGTNGSLCFQDHVHMHPIDNLMDYMHKLIHEVFAKCNQHVLDASGQPCLWLVTSCRGGYRVINSGETLDGCRHWMQTVYVLMLSKMVISTFFKLGKVALWQKNRHPDGLQLHSILG